MADSVGVVVFIGRILMRLKFSRKVAVAILGDSPIYRAHRAVIFVVAQLSC